MKRIARWLGSNGRRAWVRVLGVLCCLNLIGVGVAAAVDRPHKALILDSFGRDFSPFNVLVPSFKSELVDQMLGSITFHEAALQMDAEQSLEAELAFATHLRAVYASRPPDIVVPVGATATRFWWRHRERLFPTTPVVIGGIERRVLELLPMGPNDTAVAMHVEVGNDHILHLFPATTNIAVVIGNSALERFWVAELQKMWEPFADRVQLEWFNELPFAEIHRRAASMPPHSVLYHTLFFIDGVGVPFEHTSALEQLCAVANVPVFGVFQEHLGSGIIGGQLFSGAEIGREAARVAARVLRGESAGTIPPVIVSAGQPTFDWRQLSRWGVTEQRLPPDSVVRFRQASVWERYRGYILGALGIILLQALTIVALLVNRARRRRIEGHLRESQQFMELATAAGELGLWVYDLGSDGVWVNPSLRLLFGWNENRAVRWRDVVERVHPEDRSRMEQAFEQGTKAGGAFEFEGRLSLPDDSTKWITLKGITSREGRGRPHRLQGVVFDITARHVAEVTAERHRDELLHITRVHVLEQLASALAHELSQPLGAMLTNTETAEFLLRNHPLAWAELREVLGDIRHDSQRASEVIHSIRGLLKRHEMKINPISVQELIAECVALARPNAIERNVTIRSEVLSETHRVLGARVHLQQVLLNLLVNAMDAMSHIPPDQRQLSVRAESNGTDMITFSVRDNGSGIPPDQLEPIFGLFHSTKSTGLGVGLSISRTIIQSHGGSIWAENHPAGGAVVRFTLPAVPQGGNQLVT